MPIQIDLNKIRKEFKNTVSSKALTDITLSVETEIQRALSQKDPKDVNKALKQMVDFIEKETNQLCIKHLILSLGPLWIFASSISFFADEFRKPIGIVTLLMSFILMVRFYSIAFEQAATNVRSQMIQEDQDLYSDILLFLEKGWKPRNAQFYQDSPQMQKKLVIAVLAEYITQIQSPQNQNSMLEYKKP